MKISLTPFINIEQSESSRQHLKLNMSAFPSLALSKLEGLNFQNSTTSVVIAENFWRASRLERTNLNGFSSTQGLSDQIVSYMCRSEKIPNVTSLFQKVAATISTGLVRIMTLAIVKNRVICISAKVIYVALLRSDWLLHMLD